MAWKRVLHEKMLVAGQTKTVLCGTWRFHYRDHKIPPLDPILRRLNPLQIPTPYFFKVHFNIILSFTHRFYPCRFPDQNSVWNSFLSEACYMSNPSRLSWFNNPARISGGRYTTHYENPRYATVSILRLISHLRFKIFSLSLSKVKNGICVKLSAP